jgi:hypothetical protein
MNSVGEYRKNSLILLELLTFDEHSSPIPTDFPPAAYLSYIDTNGLIDVLHVTLDSIDIGCYIKAVPVEEDWNLGDYIITYRATLSGQELTARERLKITQTDEETESKTPILVTDLTMLTLSGEFTTVMMNDTPIQGATVMIWAYGEESKLVAKAITDAEGHWWVKIAPGQYIFEFIHPNGMILRKFTKVVNP